MKVVSPTRIVDKNGKTTTVYRRLESEAKTNTALSGRLPKTAATDKKRQAWRDQPMFGYMAKGQSLSNYVDADLTSVLGEPDTRSGTFYQLAQGTTQSEFTAMLAVASVPTVLRVSGSQGIRSADELVDYLESAGLRHLIDDNSGEVELLEQRMVDSGALIESLDLMMSPAGAQCSWADLAESIASRSLAETGVSERIWDGSLSWDAVKTIGVSNFSQFGGEILPHMDELSPEQFRSAIALVKSGSNVVPGNESKWTRRDEMTMVVYAMLRMGPDETLSMRVPGLFREMSQQGLLLDMSVEKRAQAGLFADEFVHRVRETGAEVGTLKVTPERSRLKGYPDPVTIPTPWKGDQVAEYVVPMKTLVEYFNEGISVDDSITYIARGVEAVKARGLIDNDIAQSLSDGWL